jgi:hypothetical protein
LKNHGLQSTDKTNNLDKQDSQVIDIAQTIDVDYKVILVKKKQDDSEAYQVFDGRRS